MTPGVRKILLSQKTFANHLADEEAALGLQQHGEQVSTPQQRQTSIKDSKANSHRVKRASGSGPSLRHEPMNIDSEPAVIRDHDPLSQARDVSSPSNTRYDQDPLLGFDLPQLPTQDEIEVLLSASPLSYSAARAAPTKSTARGQAFCDMCGYWGRARCMKCGVRVCGLECKTQHEETTCQKFYA